LSQNLMLLAFLFFIFYFMLIRPQQQRIKVHKKMLSELSKGKKVITSGGIIGTIVKFEGEDVVVVEVATDVKVRVARSSISDTLDAASGNGANDN
ncbi:MAG: preprotein translocase subunit YajC, partial [Alphaproteobacteria bacterium]